MYFLDFVDLITGIEIGTGNGLAKTILHNELWYVLLGIRQKTALCAAGLVN